MARSRSRSKRGSKPAKSRRSKKTEEVVEEGRRLGIDDGMVIITFLLIVTAFFVTDYLLGADYAQGLFFKGKFAG